MGSITITINTDNSAFEDNTGAELARILRTFAECADQGADVSVFDELSLRDVNGAKVGTVRVQP